MNKDSALGQLIVVMLVALFCSVLVSVAAITLKPLQERNALVERSRGIVALSGLAEPGAELSADEILAIAGNLDARVIELASGRFSDDIDPTTFNGRAASSDPETSIEIPPELDSANLARRSTHELVYIVWGDDGLLRVILPIKGQGMWSTLYGYVALESDLNTIASATFYEQAETAGLGDQITRQSWLDIWAGREVYGADGDVRFRIAGGPVEPGSDAARYDVDAISGATVTTDAVTNLIVYWFGPHGYGPMLEAMHADPPVRRTAAEEAG